MDDAVATKVAFCMRRALDERDGMGRPLRKCDVYQPLSSDVGNASQVLHAAIWGALGGLSTESNSEALLPALVEKQSVTFDEFKNSRTGVGFVPREQWQNETCARTSNSAPFVIARMRGREEQPYTSTADLNSIDHPALAGDVSKFYKLINQLYRGSCLLESPPTQRQCCRHISG